MDLGVGFIISNIGAKLGYTELVERDFLPINMRIGTCLAANIDDYIKFL